VLGPYGSAITDAVADVTEKHHKLMIAPMAATTSIWEKGRRYLIMMLAPSRAPRRAARSRARNGLKRLAVIKLDGLVANADGQGRQRAGQEKGPGAGVFETYPSSTT
jgi:branched-chain amino acid transport system substrate-binding protein